MFSVDDTIVAIATPSGRGGIGVVRISGRESTRIAATADRPQRTLAPRHATFARLSTAGRPGGERHRRPGHPDIFSRPHSYTGEDVVEISAHGSPVLLRADRRIRDGRGGASGRARRVHAAGVPARPDRSRAGRSGARSHRCGDAAPGARRLRPARGNAHGRDRRRGPSGCSI